MTPPLLSTLLVTATPAAAAARHSVSDMRIALAAKLVDWLDRLPPR